MVAFNEQLKKFSDIHMKQAMAADMGRKETWQSNLAAFLLTLPTTLLQESFIAFIDSFKIVMID